MKVLITSGGTKIPLDLVRNITNMSKGTFGSKIANEFLKLDCGHNVVFLKAKDSKSPMSTTIDISKGYNIEDYNMWYNRQIKYLPYYKEYKYETFEDYHRSLELIIGLENPDIIILAAAVSDYGVETPINGKIRSEKELNIVLKPLPKVINSVKKWSPTSKLVGFKLLVNSSDSKLIEAAQKSIIDNECDMVVANDLSDIKVGKHRIHLIFKDGDYKLYTEDSIDSNYLARMVVENSLNLVNKIEK